MPDVWHALSGHTVTRLTVLDFGTFSVGPPGQPAKRQIGIPGFLIDTDLGARLLVDSGFDALYAHDPAAAEARDRLSTFGHLIGFGPRQTLDGQLALIGLTPADITALILTHSHIDHIGGLMRLTCPLAVGAAERALPRPLYFRGSQPFAWPDVQTMRVEADTALCHGLRLIPTPGHTPGHLSLLISLPSQRPVILAADAINRASEPAEGFPDAMDPETARRSAHRLFDLQAQTGAQMIYGHDPAQWPALPKAPQPLVAAP
jgi:N-acyl homoserine lactone hydrolase